jgi:tripartite-type tricarboxylate transporter receptor subunit TctC
VRALAVTSASRWPAASDIPTMQEAGVTSYVHTLWGILLVPAATPKEIVARLNAEAVKAVQAQDVRDKLFSMGVEAVGSPIEHTASYVRDESEKYAKLVKAIGLTID